MDSSSEQNAIHQVAPEPPEEVAPSEPAQTEFTE
jgi:hypothetical protein